jgi:hypothetical protein
VAYSLATSSAVISSLHGRNRAALEQSWSVTVRIVSYPLLVGSFVMKSRAIVPKGVVGCSVVIGLSGGFG